MPSRLLLALFACVLSSPAAPAAAPPPAARELSVEELARLVRPSVAVITVRGRDGRTEGVGTGFVVSRDGLIATNHHVIGEGRAISVELADGTRHEATQVHAFDRPADLAVIRIAARGLVPLPLGDAGRLRDGQAVVAIGNPKGLKHSVVAGVVSGRRAVAGRVLIQVAIPIEPGNSGGPLLDRSGRVVGILSIKSLVTANLGFAIPSNSLAQLLGKPSPVPMAAWLTIGALDADEWQTRGASRWRQRAGRLIAEGRGDGIGGRSLCLSTKATPALPFEVGVHVKLQEETGAAGLAFHSDGGQRHYGFYPSNGQLRLTRFDGADVFSWKVLQQKASPHYRPGEWNALKVRIDKGRIRCFVNDGLVFDVEEDTLTSGKVGVVKFRDVPAEFKQFRLGKELPAARPAPALVGKVGKAVEGLPLAGVVGEDVFKKLPRGDAATLAALRERARQLEQQAARLREVAAALHQREVISELAGLLKARDGAVDLAHAALLIARLDNDEIDVDGYRGEVERMAKRVAARLKPGATEGQKLAALDQFLFRERGFHGSRADYYNRSNSYLSEVIDDREGLPITLSVLYIELARRLGVKVEGVGLPGHFVVRHVPAKGKPQLIDVFEGGVRLSRADAARKVRAMADRELEESHLRAVPPRMILVRMLHNLLNTAREERDVVSMLRYVDAVIAIHPTASDERLIRAGVRYQLGDLNGSRADVDWLLKERPEGIDLDRVRKMRDFLRREQPNKE